MIDSETFGSSNSFISRLRVVISHWSREKSTFPASNVWTCPVRNCRLGYLQFDLCRMFVCSMSSLFVYCVGFGRSSAVLLILICAGIFDDAKCFFYFSRVNDKVGHVLV